jgi:hypothetical protein
MDYRRTIYYAARVVFNIQEFWGMPVYPHTYDLGISLRKKNGIVDGALGMRVQ